MRIDVGRRCQQALGGGRCGVEWPLPPSPAGPREVRTRASRPPLRPRARGRSSTSPDVACGAADHRPSSGFAPTALFRPPPPRQGAPLGVGPHGGPAAWGLLWGPPNPCCPSPAARTLLRSFSRTSLRAGGKQDPPTSELLPGPPPLHRGPLPGPLHTPAGGPARTAHLRPVAESLPQPKHHHTQPSSDGPPPLLHLQTPGGARAESLLQFPSVPIGGWGVRLESEL